MSDTEPTYDYVFRGVEYSVTLKKADIIDGHSFILLVEDKSTADQWRGTFDKMYIEDLTQKTGNYKQYDVFYNMLHSALTQESKSVSLDLLTYADLELLRHKKAGRQVKQGSTTHPPQLNSKRYLILTYTVEFDRIHYPLPLVFVGKVDVSVLQDTIAQLREQLRIAQRMAKQSQSNRELEKLKKDVVDLLEEKQDIEEDFLQYKRSVEHTSIGNAAKEIKMLKSLAKSLEKDLLEERSKHNRQNSKHKQQYNSLLKEVDELKASNRNLRVRVKSLTNELAIYRRKVGRVMAHQSKNDVASSYRDRSSSRDRSHNYSQLSNASSRYSKGSQSRDTSRLSAASKYSSNSRNNSHLSRRSADSSSSRSRPRDRSTRHPSVQSNTSIGSGGGSTERRYYTWETTRPPRGRSNSRDRPVVASKGVRSRTPSPSFGFQRFDPTAYIQEKQRKMNLRSSTEKRRTRSRSNSSDRYPHTSSGFLYAGRSRSRASSAGSLRSRTSSVESLSDIAPASDSSVPIRKTSRPNSAGSYRSASSAWDDPHLEKMPKEHLEKFKQEDKLLSSTPERHNRTKSRTQRDTAPDRFNSDTGDHKYFDRSAEIQDIDERLNRLQEFMKNNMT